MLNYKADNPIALFGTKHQNMLFSSVYCNFTKSYSLSWKGGGIHPKGIGGTVLIIKTARKVAYLHYFVHPRKVF